MSKWDSESIGAFLAIVLFPAFITFLCFKQSAIYEILNKFQKKWDGADYNFPLKSSEKKNSKRN
jgi:hypothetical protein